MTAGCPRSSRSGRPPIRRPPPFSFMATTTCSPPEPLDEGASPRFEPVQRNGQLLARGASDDKGQVLFHALAVPACLAAGGRDAPPVTLKLLIEGEEEAGSTNFVALLEARHDRLP